MTMSEPEVMLEQINEDHEMVSLKSPEGRTRRQTPSRMRCKSRGRTAPRRTQSADSMSPLPVTRTERIPAEDLSELTPEMTDSNENNDGTEASVVRRSPRRCKSANVSHIPVNGEHGELLEMAKLQAAKQKSNPSSSSTDMKSPVRIKVSVRRKKDGTLPSASELKKMVKVPVTGTMDQGDNNKGNEDRKSSAQSFNPNNLENILGSSGSGRGGDDGTVSTRGRQDVLHREGRARSRSRASRHRAASRGRPATGTVTSDDEDDDDVDCVDEIIQNRREQGLGETLSPKSSKPGLKKISPPSTPATRKKAYANLNDDAQDAEDKSKLSPEKTRERFTDASEWSNVVDELLQKRKGAGEAPNDSSAHERSPRRSSGGIFSVLKNSSKEEEDAEDPKSKRRGLRILGSSKKPSKFTTLD